MHAEIYMDKVLMTFAIYFQMIQQNIIDEYMCVDIYTQMVK